MSTPRSILQIIRKCAQEKKEPSKIELEEISKILSVRGSDVDSSLDGKSRSLFHYVISFCLDEKNCNDLIQILFDKGADINRISEYGDSPFRFAVIKGYISTVELLLNLGADPFDKKATSSQFRETIEDVAKKHNKLTLLPLINYVKAKSKCVAPVCMTITDIIKHAADNNAEPSISMLEAAYQKFPFLNVAINSERKAAIHYAAEAGFLGVVKWLLDKGVAVDVKAIDGYTPLIYAAQKRRVQVVEMLLQRGASVHQKAKSELTPLHAVFKDMNDYPNGKLKTQQETFIYEIIKWLIKYNIDLNSRLTITQLTGLHLAASHQLLSVVELLVLNHADMNLVCAKGKDVIMYASYNPAIIDFINKNTKGYQFELKQALAIYPKRTQRQFDNGDMLEFLTYKHEADLMAYVKQCAKFKVQPSIEQLEKILSLSTHEYNKNVLRSIWSDSSQTILHVAASSGLTLVVKWLLSKNISFLQENMSLSADKSTPLHFAARNGHVDVCQLLLEHKASVKEYNASGETPLLAAMQINDSEKRDKIIVLLYQYKANINISNYKNSSYMTALHIAACNGYSSTVQLLLNLGADPICKNLDKMTASQCAAAWGYESIARLLTHFEDKKAKKKSALMTVSEVIEKCIQEKREPSESELDEAYGKLPFLELGVSFQNSALGLAVENKFTKTVNWLINKKVSLHFPGHEKSMAVAAYINSISLNAPKVVAVVVPDEIKSDSVYPKIVEVKENLPSSQVLPLEQKVDINLAKNMELAMLSFFDDSSKEPVQPLLQYESFVPPEHILAEELKSEEQQDELDLADLLKLCHKNADLFSIEKVKKVARVGVYHEPTNAVIMAFSYLIDLADKKNNIYAMIALAEISVEDQEYEIACSYYEKAIQTLAKTHLDCDLQELKAKMNQSIQNMIKMADPIYHEKLKKLIQHFSDITKLHEIYSSTFFSTKVAVETQSHNLVPKI